MKKVSLLIAVLFIAPAVCQAKTMVAPEPEDTQFLVVSNWQDRKVLEQKLQLAFARVKKAKDAGPNEYYGGEAPALLEYKRLKQTIQNMGGEIKERKNKVTVNWPSRS